MLGHGKSGKMEETELRETILQIMLQLASPVQPQISQEVNFQSLRSPDFQAISEKRLKSISKDFIEVLNLFVDYEQSYLTMGYFNADFVIMPQDSLYVKLSNLSTRLEGVISEIELPKENGGATKRWWQVARIRHILHNIEVYYKAKEKMIIEYKNLKTKRTKNDCNHRIL